MPNMKSNVYKAARLLLVMSEHLEAGSDTDRSGENSYVILRQSSWSRQAQVTSLLDKILNNVTPPTESL